MLTISMSRRPLSTIARRTSRPMRPKPLIATRTAILQPPHDAASSWPRTTIKSSDSCPLQGRPCFFCSSLGRDLKLLVNILVRTARSEGMHANEFALRSQIALPAERRGRFDADTHVRVAQDLPTIGLGLFFEQVPARHGDYARCDVLV